MEPVMITAEEKHVMKKMEGKKIEFVRLTEWDHISLERTLEIYLDDDTYLEIYQSTGVMRIAGFRTKPSSDSRSDHDGALLEIHTTTGKQRLEEVQRPPSRHSPSEPSESACCFMTL
ncbi:MAG: hypothetical protein HQL51_01340 [Magnetococcales bacterium]|nr:hypothetical protein [Magnetococcales bacterium]